MRFVCERVNPLEESLVGLSNEELLARSNELKARIKEGRSEDSRAMAFALVREASKRARAHRHFDVQLVAGMVLDEGKIAEEATGEGKTIACYPAIYMAALEGMKVHVVTVNDYLVQRDAEFARPIFEMLGVSVGFITSDMPAYGAAAEGRRKAYACDVTYGINSEFGFDYLRDNMKMSVSDQVQGRLDFAIVDEVDNILIDEARTPLIISGPAYGQTDRFSKADMVARELISRNRPWQQANNRVESIKRNIKSLNGELSKGGDTKAINEKLRAAEEDLARAEEELGSQTKYYEVELDKKSAHMTHEGVAAAQDIAGVGSFYIGANMEWPHLMEQSLRAHMVYERDKDYVVQQGAVLIVDEFTGRILEGRQWSDGLHQAVEAKEHVKVKEETQTIATITLQNYFKLYKKLAGMTGTAMTEAAEFSKIYNLDAVTVPTHRPVNRVDYEDRIYADIESKYDAIVEEINDVSKSGRPVLVGTTSIEKSEHLSGLLIRRHGIEHNVLNARPENAAREAEIVSLAGMQRPLKKGSSEMVGTVTIATNMAGRGTDIKLGPGVVWDNCRVPPAEKLAALGVEQESLFPPGSNKCCLYCDQYNAATSCSHCFKPRIDADFPKRGRTDCREVVPCGLHIVGTERHESRRIDNQLRGRSGRQGDPGSSRFFLSLQDELMAIFAGEWTMKVLGWLGLQGQQAIEDRRVTKGIERAQKKVEERNFETRKNLLEYDEVMDHQRHGFYSTRQKILEGRELEGLVLDMLRDSVADGVTSFLDGKYPQRVIAEWVRQNLQIAVRDEQIRGRGAEGAENLEHDIKTMAKEEATELINTHVGEYMDPDLDPKEWDLKSLASWAMSRFGVDFSQAQLRNMEAGEVETAIYEAAAVKIDQMELSPLHTFLEEGYTEAALAQWLSNRYGLPIKAQQLKQDDPQAVVRFVASQVEAAYHRREIEYPVEFALERTVAQAGMDNIYAVAALVDWANRKYDAGWEAQAMLNKKIDEVRKDLLALSEQWSGTGWTPVSSPAGESHQEGEENHGPDAHATSKLEAAVEAALGTGGTAFPGRESDTGKNACATRAIEFAARRFDTQLTPEQLGVDPKAAVVHAGRQFLRREFTELERFVLLQIYDVSWKDHLLLMDQLKSGIGLRSFAEQDPKIAYKREGMKHYADMMIGAREKVADMIFKVRLSPEAQLANVYQISSMVHEQLSGYDHLARNMADQQAAAKPEKIKPIVRETPRVGRNEPCPCGSGKKYKQCHGKGL
jgi:preprotein translocase subunit SecA